MNTNLYQWRGAIPALMLSFIACILFAFTAPIQAATEPVDGVTLSGTEVRLFWDGSVVGDLHDVQLAHDDGSVDPFTNLILDERTSQGQLVIKDGLMFGGSYVWRVRSVQEGIPGDWSLLSTFAIRTVPLDFALNVEVFSGVAPPQPGLTIFNHCDSIVGYTLEGELALLLETKERVSDCRVIGDGRLLYVGGGRAWIVSLAGEVLWASPDDNNFRVHHSASMMPSGNVLMVVRDYRDIEQDGVTRTWQGDRIVEMNPETNEIVWDWSTFDHYTTEDYDVHQSNHWNDWTHVNDAHYVEADNSIYISCRHLSRITRIDYDSGKIIYNMGMDFPSGDVHFGDDLFSYQHSPFLLANGNMVLFDNGNRRGGGPAGQDGTTFATEIAFTGSPPSDAEIVWSWEVPEYCPSTGDADRLDNGHTLVTATQLSGVYEVTEAGEMAWRLSILENEACPGLRPGYRATRVPGLFLDHVEELCLGDLDEDGQVGVDDILSLLSQWGGSGTADLDMNGVIDVNDVLILLQKWGPCSS